MSSSVFLYPAMIATIISMVGLSYFAYRRHNSAQPRTLSQLATTSAGSLWQFRLILWVCSVLFGITLLFSIAPVARLGGLIAIAGLTMCLSEIILAIIPAKNHWPNLFHNLFGYLMGVAMFALVVLFWASLGGIARLIEGTLGGLMVAAFGAMLADRPRFIRYELAYIYLSHVSIVVVGAALLTRL